MRIDIIIKLIKKELLDLRKNASILPVVIMAPFLAYLMSKLNEAPADIMLPIWVLYSQSMIGIMVPAFLTAEEKEKGTLDSLLISPARYNEIITGKILFALIVIFIDVLLVLGPNGGLVGNQAWIWLAVILGSIFFVQVGLIIGLFTRNQVSAGAFSSPAMLFFFLTPMFSGILPSIFKTIVEYMPSLAVMEMVRTGLKNGAIGTNIYEIITLIIWNLIAYFVTMKGIRHQFS